VRKIGKFEKYQGASEEATRLLKGIAIYTAGCILGRAINIHIANKGEQ
jgi:hypothetical protein